MFFIVGRLSTITGRMNSAFSLAVAKTINFILKFHLQLKGRVTCIDLLSKYPTIMEFSLSRDVVLAW